jgi:hypothetical protein
MTEEEENIFSPPDACGKKKHCFVLILSAFVLLATFGYAAILHYPQPGVLVPVAQNPPDFSVLERRIDALETQIKALNEPVPASQAASDSPSLSDEVRTLKAQIQNKDAQDRQTMQKFVAAAFAFWDLRELAEDGRIFVPQFAALRAVSADDPEISEWVAKLEPYAAVATPTLTQLRDSLALEEKAAPAPVAEGENSTFMSRIMALLRPLVSVRPLHDPRFADLEKALDSGDAAAAIEALNALPDDVRKSLAAWQSKLGARASLDTILLALEARFTTPSSPRGGAQ